MPLTVHQPLIQLPHVVEDSALADVVPGQPWRDLLELLPGPLEVMASPLRVQPFLSTHNGEFSGGVREALRDIRKDLRHIDQSRGLVLT